MPNDAPDKQVEIVYNSIPTIRQWIPQEKIFCVLVMALSMEPDAG